MAAPPAAMFFYGKSACPACPPAEKLNFFATFLTETGYKLSQNCF